MALQRTTIFVIDIHDFVICNHEIENSASRLFDVLKRIDDSDKKHISYSMLANYIDDAKVIAEAFFFLILTAHLFLAYRLSKNSGFFIPVIK